MPRQSLSQGCGTAWWTRHLSGLTLKPSVLRHGVASWMSSLRDTRASHSLSLASERASEIRDTYGLMSQESSASASQQSLFSKMSGDTSTSGLQPCEMSSEEWILSLKRRSSARLKLVRGTIGSASSSLLPTPSVCGNYNRKGASKHSGNGLATAIREMLPTPLAGTRDASPKFFKRGNANLAARVMYPTITATPYGRNKSASAGSKVRPSLEKVDGGVLNPEWVEWFMGWPIGWTELEPAEMGLSQSRPHTQCQHCCADLSGVSE